MTKKLLIGNWKAHPGTSEEARDLFEFEIAEAAKYENIKTVVCPPVMFLKELAQIPNNILGAQDVFWNESEIFEPQKLGINYVLVGHSSRRYPLVGEGENDIVINKKLKAALLADITPVLLVGERERGENREKILSEQLLADLEGLTKEEILKVLIAYEPVWAISTNPNAKPDTAENTLGAIEIIKKILFENWKLKNLSRAHRGIENWPILYGGSVNSKNIGDFLSHPEIFGAVVGAASLKKEEFSGMLEVLSKI